MDRTAGTPDLADQVKGFVRGGGSGIPSPMRVPASGILPVVARPAAAALLAVVLGVFVEACAPRKVAPLPVVESVDLTRYLGAWFEIALIPNRFQEVCVADTQARYSLDGEVLRVRNRCRKADGEIEEAVGIARVVPGSGNAKLRVSFFRPFYGDYWILALDPDYRWALIGEPGREYGWILSRSPELDEASIEAALAVADARGFDRASFRRTPQTMPLD